MKSTRSLLKKRFGIYGKLLISFLIILGIPIVVSTLFYSYTMKLVKAQSDHMGQNILKMTKHDIDAQLEGVRNFETRWFMDENVREIADVEGNITKKYAQTLLSIYQDLNRQMNTEELLKKAFIYFEGSDKIVSTDGNMDLSMYYKLYLEQEDWTYEEFREFLRKHHFYDSVLLKGVDGKISPVMLLSLRNQKGDLDAATIGFIMDEEKLRKRLLSTRESDVEMMILTESGESIRPKDAYLELKVPDYEKYKTSAKYHINELNRDIWVTSSSSDQTNWTYLMLTSSGAFAQNVSRVQIFFIIGLFLSICTGFGLSWYLAGKNYNPFRKLVTMMQAQTPAEPEFDRDMDELQWLSSQVETILQKNVDTQKMLDKNKKHMRKFYLMQLLSSDCEEEQLERYQIYFPNKYFLTTVLMTRPIMPNDRVDEQTAGLRRFIVRNIFSELSEKEYRAESFEFGDRIITIFNLSEQETDIVENIHVMMEKLHEMVFSPFHFDICGLIGSMHPGQSGIRASYREAVDLVEYLATLDENIISMEDICGIEPNYEYFDEITDKLVRIISIGDQEQAEKSIREIFGQYMSGKASLNLYRSLVYEIIGVLLKGATAGGYTDAASEIALPKESVIKRSMKETEEQLILAAVEICRKICEIRKATADNFNLSKEVEAFIDSNFMNPDLNISIASQHFDRSPAYLSNIYKKQTGRSLLEYINMKRIVYAETLLKEGVNVVEAAEQSGFRDSGGFIRTFKRYRGITPGQLKTAKNR